MKEQLISFETAKLAKDKGFNIACIYFYNPKYKLPITGVEYDSDRPCCWDWNNNSDNGIASPYPNQEVKGQCSAPTQSLLQKWLRDVHNIDVWAQPFMASNGYGKYYLPDETYSYFIFKDGVFINDEIDMFDFEEALEKGLQEALRLI